MAEKKYQVFISSTYSDLKEERRNILSILLSAGCIPAGMEAFVATDAEQFNVIKKVIDLCDYYILIIGKRYGSVNPDTNISYTEMEYDYAIEKGIPVLAFAIDESIVLPPEKVDSDQEKVEKLKSFRTKALENRLAYIWKDIGDLTGNLAISIMKAIDELPRTGWQKAVNFDEASLRREIMTLEEQCAEYKKRLKAAEDEIASFNKQYDLAFENTNIEIKYFFFTNYNEIRHASITVKLSEIFKIIATEMMDVSIPESRITSSIENNISAGYIHIDDKQLIKKVLNQFRALELIKSHFSSDNKILYWSLTTKGKKARDDMILIKKKKKNR